MNYTIEADYVIEALQELVRIDSSNPTLTPGAAGEAGVAAYVAEELGRLGLAVNSYVLAPGRVNVVGVLAGNGRGRSLMLHAHMDTVGVGGMAEPFSAAIRNGRLYGRGALDMKGGLAAMLGATQALAGNSVSMAGDLIVAAVADEESVSLGTEALVGRYRTSGAIVAKPTGLDVCIAHRGFVWFDIETFGRAAHGSRHEEGIDANMRMGRVLGQLERLEWELRQRPAHALVGTPSLHAARIEGGSEMSVYADHCRLQVERRTNPGETEQQARGEMEALLQRLRLADPGFEARLTTTFVRQPFTVAANAAVVTSVATAAAAHLGRRPRFVGQSFWTDAALLTDAGIETVLIGPKGAGLHSAEEWVEVESVVDLAHILSAAAEDYCSDPR